MLRHREQLMGLQSAISIQPCGCKLQGPQSAALLSPMLYEAGLGACAVCC